MNTIFQLITPLWRRHTLKWLGAVFLLTSILPTTSSATLVVRRNIMELTIKSSQIVEGTVIDTQCIQNTNGLVCTQVTMEVTETLKGKHSPVVTFSVPGGKSPDGMILKIAGSPAFKKGESSIVFLEGSSGTAVTGMSQGRFTIQKIDNETYAIQNTKGLCMLDARGPMPGENGGPVTDWPTKFTSQETRNAASLKAGVMVGSSCGHIQGSVLRVPIKIFKDTVKDCNPENYSAHKESLKGN